MTNVIPVHRENVEARIAVKTMKSFSFDSVLRRRLVSPTCRNQLKTLLLLDQWLKPPLAKIFQILMISGRSGVTPPPPRHHEKAEEVGLCRRESVCQDERRWCFLPSGNTLVSFRSFARKNDSPSSKVIIPPGLCAY